MKLLRPGDFGQGFAPFGSTAASVLEASFCAPVNSSPGWEIEFPIVQNFGLSEEQSSTLTQEGMKGELDPVKLELMDVSFIFFIAQKLLLQLAGIIPKFS